MLERRPSALLPIAHSSFIGDGTICDDGGEEDDDAVVCISPNSASSRVVLPLATAPTQTMNEPGRMSRQTCGRKTGALGDGS